MDPGCPLPVAQISPRSASEIREALAAHGHARVALEAEIALDSRPLRTIAATIVGARDPGEAVVVAGHVQEPGACDNASGVATLLEGARSLAAMLRSGTLDPPSRSLVFVWGNEMEQSRVYLEKGGRRVTAAIAADMTGESAERTGAVALLERMPDPGALEALPPDEHTAWGAGSVDPSRISPSGLAVIARSALVDVGARAPGWSTAEHPYEGGSDHSVFADQGIPAVLFWHFTDFAYHTSLDRLDHVDPEEMHRDGAAILSTALAVADARPGDLDRYLASLRMEQDLRLSACAKAGRHDLAQRWKDWCTGARMWLRELCLTQHGAEAGHEPKHEG